MPRKKTVHRKPAAPSHEWNERTAENVWYMKMCGATTPRIADVLGLTVDQVNNHYSHELSTAKLSANAEVMKTAYLMAVSGKSPALTIFWLKTQCGLRETTRHEVVNIDSRIVDVITEWRQETDSVGDEAYNGLVSRLAALQPPPDDGVPEYAKEDVGA